MIARKWIILCAVAFIAYAFISAKYRDIKNSPAETKKITSDLKQTATEVISTFTTSKKGEDLIKKAFTYDGELIKNTPAPVKEEVPQLSSIDSMIGEGAKAECGQKVTLHYVLSLMDGKVVNNTRENSHPITFVIGKQKIIHGIELGTIGMQEGGIRKLVIPAKLAYDDPKFTTNLIPPASAVKAEIELLKIAPAAKNIDALQCN